MFQIDVKEVKKAVGISVKKALRLALISQVKIPHSEFITPYRTLK